MADHTSVRDTIHRATVEILDAHIGQCEGRFTFVQVGANDGRSFDWVYEFVTTRRLRGFVIEPLPDLFHALCSAYAPYPDVTPIRVAIHRTEREIDIHRVDPLLMSGLPEWASAIASVDRNHHRKSGIPSSVMRAERVPCMTLPELLATYDVGRVDFLQIDVEGYDSEVLRMVDLSTLRPSVVRFEHNIARGVMSMDDLAECLDRLVRSGYLLIMDASDVVAYLPIAVAGR